MAQHRARRGEVRNNKPYGAVNSCGLMAFESRTEADYGARFMPLDRKVNRPYHCVDGCGLWHVGYLPTLVVRGVVTADEWYGRNGHKPMRNIIPPLLEHITNVTQFGTPTIFRRDCPITDRALWTITIDTPDAGQLVARDYDSPAEAATVALAEYRAILDETPAPALELVAA